MSFPVFFDPLVEGEMCLVDGGLSDNMPVTIACDEGYKHILAVNVNRFTAQGINDLKNGPQIVFRCIESVLHAMDSKRKIQAGLTINVTDDSTPLSFYRKKEFIALGEHAVKSNLKTLEDFFKPRFGLFRAPMACGN